MATEREILSLCERVRAELAMKWPRDRSKLEKLNFLVNRRMRTSAGRAAADGTVEIASRVFANPANEHELLETILHEIAHVVVGLDHGHDSVWRRKILDYGGRGETCHQLEVERSRRTAYAAECKKCGSELVVGPVRAKRMNRRQGIYVHLCCGGELQLKRK